MVESMRQRASRTFSFMAARWPASRSARSARMAFTVIQPMAPRPSATASP
jgi:hypothetical protein